MKPLPKIGNHSSPLGPLATVVSDRTRAPIEDGVDGTGVYASRLRSRRSARGPQSPKVLVPGGIHVRSDIRRLRRNLHGIPTIFFLNGYSDQSISRSKVC